MSRRGQPGWHYGLLILGTPYEVVARQVAFTRRLTARRVHSPHRLTARAGRVLPGRDVTGQYLALPGRLASEPAMESHDAGCPSVCIRGGQDSARVLQVKSLRLPSPWVPREPGVGEEVAAVDVDRRRPLACGVLHGMNSLSAEEQYIANLTALVPAHVDRVPRSPVVRVVLNPSIDANCRPHLVLMGEQLNQGWPHEMHDGQVVVVVEDIDPPAIGGTELSLHGCRVPDGPLDDLLDGELLGVLSEGTRASIYEGFAVEHYGPP